MFKEKKKLNTHRTDYINCIKSNSLPGFSDEAEEWCELSELWLWDEASLTLDGNGDSDGSEFWIMLPSSPPMNRPPFRCWDWRLWPLDADGSSTDASKIITESDGGGTWFCIGWGWSPIGFIAPKNCCRGLKCQVFTKNKLACSLINISRINIVLFNVTYDGTGA